MDIAGIAIGGINLLANLHAKFRDLDKWTEADLPVTLDWLDEALKGNVLAGTAGDFAWMRLERLPTAELKGTHGVVIAYNEARRTCYRIVCGPSDDRLILTQKLQLPPKA